MSDDSVSSDNMSANPFPFRRREPNLSADEADALLSGEPLSAAASPEVVALGAAVAALRSGGQAGEFAGLAEAVSAFADSARNSRTDPHPPRRRKVLTPILGAKVVIVAVAGSLALGGAAAAAGLALPGSSHGRQVTAAGATSSDPSGTASPTASATPSADATDTDDPTGSPSPSASPSATHEHPRPLSAAAIYGLCREYADQSGTVPTAGPTPPPTTGSSPAGDDGDSADGSSSAPERAELLATLQTAADAKGVSVAQMCAAALAAGKPGSTDKTGDGSGHGQQDGQQGNQGDQKGGQGSGDRGSHPTSGDGGGSGGGSGSSGHGGGSGDGGGSGGGGGH